MSGKKKDFPPARTRAINLRITEDLYKVLTLEAEKSHLSLSEYIRILLTSRQPKVEQTYEIVFDSKELLEVFRNLGHYGNNLNQIARYLNQGGNMTNEVWKEIKDCVAEIYEIRDAVKEMAGEYRGSH
jgi:RNA binding exosome subunit